MDAIVFGISCVVAIVGLWLAITEKCKLAGYIICVFSIPAIYVLSESVAQHLLLRIDIQDFLQIQIICFHNHYFLLHHCS